MTLKFDGRKARARRYRAEGKPKVDYFGVPACVKLWAGSAWNVERFDGTDGRL